MSNVMTETTSSMGSIGFPSIMSTSDSPLTDLDDELLRGITTAEQQPDWGEALQVAAVRAQLARLPGLVSSDETHQLRALLAQAAEGRYHVIQAGDCAEDPAECAPSTVMRKAALIDALAALMTANTGKPVLRVGRIAGQFSKPRSSSTEVVGGIELPAYRGHMVNRPEPTAQARRPDPTRMLDCYHAAYAAVAQLRQRVSSWAAPSGAPVWTSHEALVFDYELPMLRRTPSGGTLLASTHLPWIGERTRDPDGPHAMMLARVANPVACKVGPTIEPDELLALCARLDPECQPGRLVLIARMGADAAGHLLPPLVSAVRLAGHPAVWLCDPMHGNTVKLPDSRKVRYVKTIVAEINAFQQAVAAAGGIPGGLHLETTPFDVTECAWDDPAELQIRDEGRMYAKQPVSHCDPRLNPTQAVEAVSVWGLSRS